CLLIENSEKGELAASHEDILVLMLASLRYNSREQDLLYNSNLVSMILHSCNIRIFENLDLYYPLLEKLPKEQVLEILDQAIEEISAKGLEKVKFVIDRIGVDACNEFFLRRYLERLLSCQNSSLVAGISQFL